MRKKKEKEKKSPGGMTVAMLDISLLIYTKCIDKFGVCFYFTLFFSFQNEPCWCLERRRIDADYQSTKNGSLEFWRNNSKTETLKVYGSIPHRPFLPFPLCSTATFSVMRYILLLFSTGPLLCLESKKKKSEANRTEPWTAVDILEELRDRIGIVW